jgi:GT2 family glycosyltransferase
MTDDAAQPTYERPMFPVDESTVPVVSVIVPTRDRRVLLQRKLQALEIEQLDFEVIVVADACTDDTEKFLSSYRPPYRFSWTTGPGMHAATARNLGAARARAPVLLFSDDDVIPGAGWVEDNRRLHETPGFVGLSKQRLPPHLEVGDKLTAVHGWWNTNGRSTSVRAELFREAGGYDPAFSTYGGEDPDLGWRLKRLGARFRLLTGATVEHWDEGYLENLEAKARSAGAAHVRVWRKHGAGEVAWALGVHPLSLALKRVLLGPWAAALIGEDRYLSERAYAAGAREELRRAEEPNA